MLLLQEPPVVNDDRVLVEPTHNTVLPVIANGVGLTEKTRVDIQPAQLVNVIIHVPPATPVMVVLDPVIAMDGDDVTVATAVLLLVHEPHDISVDQLTVEPAHTLDGPEGVAGTGLT